MSIARVVIFQKYADLDRALDYLIPPGLCAPAGSIVKVPLGSRVVEGVVFSCPDQSEVQELKEIISVEPFPLPPEFVDLAGWLSIRAGCSAADALSLMLPPETAQTPQVYWQVDEEAAAACDLTEKQQMVVDMLRSQEPMRKGDICRNLGISLVPVNNLVSKEILVPVKKPADFQNWPLQQVEHLTLDQAEAIACIEKKTGMFQKGAEFLLYGATGSGKTEVYIRLAQRVLSVGRQALILVPEIALTAQLVARFRAAFANQVAVLHSGLSAGVRSNDWARVFHGEVGIVIGTRSAVFAPLKNLGLVVVDEEHEPAYKQEETPRYHARDVALFRARRHRGAAVLGSATPALESFARAEAGRYCLLEMPRRIHSGNRIVTEVVDMRQELQQGNRDMLSRSLLQALKAALAGNEQALLFLNRRGVAPTVLCRNCGFRYNCPNCSTALTLHSNGILKCHHCGVTAQMAELCPECGSRYLRALGLGTQKLEARLAAVFPDCQILRLDRDTAGSAATKEHKLHRFYEQGSGILLGTQMIAKGLDFPKVTVVGIVLADLSLGMADFRAAERTFQLVTQAAGRTGRADRPGKVIIQTYQPEHYSIKYATTGDYRGFYEHDMRIRSAAGLPPFSALTRILVSAEQQKPLLAQVEKLNSLLAGEEIYELLYAGPAPLERLKGRYRWHFLLRHPGTGAAWQGIEELRRKIKPDKTVRTIFDNNPYNFM